MKRSIRNTLVGLVTAAALLVASVIPASAAATISEVVHRGGASAQIVLNSNGSESYAVIDLQNLRTRRSSEITTSYLVNSCKLAQNSWYKAVLDAYDSDDELVNSATAYICNAPSMKLKYHSGSKMKLTWKKVYGSSSYSVYMSSNGGKSYKKVRTTRGTSYVTKKLPKYKNFYFYVIANKKVGSRTYKSAKPSKMAGGYIYTTWR